MPSYGATITIDTATPFALRIRRALEQGELRAPIGEAGKLVTMRHFRDKEANPETHATAKRLGARPVGLFGQFARATSSRPDSAGAVVSIKHPAIRQRIEGGPIRSLGKLLTIPANAAAYGRSAGDFGGTLSLLYYKDRSGATKAALGTETKTKGKPPSRTVYFWLVRETKPQAPDPTAIPDAAAYAKGMEDAIGEWLQERI